MNPVILATLQAGATTPGAHRWLAMAADGALVVMAVAVTLLAVQAIRVLTVLRRGMQDVRSGLDTRLVPVSERLRSISDNVEFITDALRTDVARLNASVRALSDRLQQASDRMEERIEEFNALMTVVQDEAEELFLDTAATVRGVRKGARAITGTRGPEGADGDGSSPTPAGRPVPAPKADAEGDVDAAPDPADEPAAAP